MMQVEWSRGNGAAGDIELASLPTAVWVDESTASTASARKNSKLADAFPEHFPYEVIQLVEEYARVPHLIIFLAEQVLLQEGAPVAQPRAANFRTPVMDPEATELLHTLIRKIKAVCEVGIVLTTREPSLISASLLAPYIIDNITARTTIPRREISLSEQFAGLFSRSVQPADNSASKAALIERWLSENAHLDVRNLVILDPENDDLRARFPCNSVRIRHLLFPFHLFLEQDEIMAHNILTHDLLPPEAPAILLRHGLVESFPEMDELAELIRYQMPPNEAEAALSLKFMRAVRQFMSRNPIPDGELLDVTCHKGRMLVQVLSAVVRISGPNTAAAFLDIFQQAMERAIAARTASGAVVLDPFSYMIRQVRDERLPLLHRKLYIKPIVLCYAREKIGALIAQVMPQFASREAVATMVQTEEELLAEYTAAVRFVTINNAPRAVVPNRT